MAEHLRKVIDRLSALPEDQQEAVAAQIELYLDESMDSKERERIAAQLADPHETHLEHLLNEAHHEIASGRVYDLDEIL
jgi:uncharacterized membrane protein